MSQLTDFVMSHGPLFRTHKLSDTSMKCDSRLPYEEREQRCCSGGTRGPGSNSSLVAKISEICYLLLPSRDMVEMSLKPR